MRVEILAPMASQWYHPTSEMRLGYQYWLPMATLPGKWSTVHNDRDTYMYMVNVPTHVQVHVHALVHVQCSFWCNMPSILIFLCCGNEAGLIKSFDVAPNSTQGTPSQCVLFLVWKGHWHSNIFRCLYVPCVAWSFHKSQWVTRHKMESLQTASRRYKFLVTTSHTLGHTHPYHPPSPVSAWVCVRV